MSDLAGLDLEEIAIALADQSAYEHRWLLDPETGETLFWTRESGLDGEPVDLDEVDLIAIDPLPSWVWYQDNGRFRDTRHQRTDRAAAGPGARREGGVPSVQGRVARGMP